MKSLRFPISMSVLLLLMALSGPLTAQVDRRDGSTDLNTHRFQPKAITNQVRPKATAATTGISPSALQQISALLQEKNSRTPAQRKISSQLLYTVRMMQGQPAANGVPYLHTGVELDERNNLFVDITAHVSEGLLERLRAAGVQILRSYPAYHSIRAFVPPDQLENIANFPEVTFIMPREQAMTMRAMLASPSPGVPRISAGLEQRAARVQNYLASVLPKASAARIPGKGAITNTGSVTSEGDVTHRAVDARAHFGISGVGLKIGVISDGVSSMAASQATGDLPSTVTVLPGQAGSGDEGTAMLEIIYDLAPGAQLYFATALNGIGSFAQNIRDLRTAGCDIIVDDVGYFVESPFQDGQAPSVVSTYNGGVVTQAVNDVTADGAMYFSAAANSGNLDSGTSGTYEGDFVDGGAMGLLPGGTVHQFAPGQLYDPITSYGYYPFLHWSDPLGGSANDYDLFVLDPTGTTVLASSTDIQDGTQDPLEAVGYSVNIPGNLIVVFKKTGAADRYFQINTNRSGLQIATQGETHGHSTAAEAYGVAATPAYLAIGLGYPSGPFPNPFNSTNIIEPYSSDGPRHLFFQPDGTPFTPGNFSSTGGLVRQKPDVTAADGVSVTGVGNFGSPFYGTSAAAPHGAAIAALVKSAEPTLSNADVRTSLTSTAIDIMGSGVDRDSGAGILDAFAAVNSLGIPPLANPEIDTVTATENPGNGDGYIEAGEGAKIVITLKNTTGAAAATNITGTLTTMTPGVTITQPNTTTFPNLPKVTGTGQNQVPLTFTLASDAACGLTGDFALALNYTGGPARTVHFNVPTGPPPVSLTSTLGTTPTPVPGITTATGTQTGRIYRDGSPSACGSPKTFPGMYDTSLVRAFDSYTFTACNNSCADITLTPQTGSDYALFSAAYSPSFTPGDPSVNYTGDGGSSPAIGYPGAYGVDVVSGNTYTVVVHEVSPGGGVGNNYNLQISGCSINCLTPNQVPVAEVTDVSVFAGANGTANASIDDGSYDPEGGTVTITQTPAGPYPVGDTSVMLTIVDDKGATAQASATVTVAWGDFAFTSALTPITVTAGQSGSQHVNITPSPTYNPSITFSCSGLPAKSACSFVPASVTPGGSAADVVMTVTTTATITPASALTGATFGAWLPFSGLGLITLASAGTRKRSRKAVVTLVLLLVLVLLTLISCGGGSKPQPIPGTPLGTYTITVNATSIGVNHNTTFTLTVQ